ncbi:hypothetical protein M0812_21537 [Anaeramoeba flamelloides]|uniref:E3 ubiquitin-protein ligase ARIH1-like UBA-like domain-containing protein n=1 Tax=Anaeramoeba flamelloides TaxID=1746091 RepID=A0AAV7YXG1_9EUKA|nr:hypothetical protein M0812_21537 [Anaeramoeba flamelloides]
MKTEMYIHVESLLGEHTKKIKNIAQVLNLPSQVVGILLRHFNWNSDRVLEGMLVDREKTLENANINLDEKYSSALGVTVQTIKRHLNMEKEGDILFSTSYFLKNTRNKLSNEEIMLIIQTWLELCTCKSGDYKQVWNGQYEDAVEDDDNNDDDDDDDDDDNNAKNNGDEDDDEGYGGGTGSACIDACCGLNEFNQDNRILVYNMNSIIHEKDSNKKKGTELNKEINQIKKRKRIFVTRRHQTQTDKKICQQIQEKMIKNGFQKRCNNTYLKYKPKEVKQYSYLRCHKL